MRAVVLALTLHGCITPTVWSEKPPGIYPAAAAELNGPPQYLFGMKWKLPFDHKVNR